MFKKYLLKVFYITSLIIGVCMLITLIGVCVGMVYGIVMSGMEEFSKDPFSFKEGVITVAVIGSVIGVFYLLTESPRIIKWSWRRLTKKKLENE